MKRHEMGLLALALCGLLSVAACAQKESAITTETEPPPAETAPPAAAIDTANAVTTDAAGTRVNLFVTDDGFVPASVHVPAGQPVTLVVKRVTDRTCATELVMKEHNINQTLPLDQAVEIKFTPAKAGELSYACGMDMIKGTIVVD